MNCVTLTQATHLKMNLLPTEQEVTATRRVRSQMEYIMPTVCSGKEFVKYVMYSLHFVPTAHFCVPLLGH